MLPGNSRRFSTSFLNRLDRSVGGSTLEGEVPISSSTALTYISSEINVLNQFFWPSRDLEGYSAVR